MLFILSCVHHMPQMKLKAVKIFEIWLLSKVNNDIREFLHECYARSCALCTRRRHLCRAYTLRSKIFLVLPNALLIFIGNLFITNPRMQYIINRENIRVSCRLIVLAWSKRIKRNFLLLQGNRVTPFFNISSYCSYYNFKNEMLKEINIWNVR